MTFTLVEVVTWGAALTSGTRCSPSMRIRWLTARLTENILTGATPVMERTLCWTPTP